MSATEHGTMNLKLVVWRQAAPDKPGRFETYEAKNITPHHSFLEMLDVVNEDLIKAGQDPIAVDHDCREGICGRCSAVVNGVPHGGQERTTLCQLHMRKFKDGDVIHLEPWRARAFPVVRDLIVHGTRTYSEFLESPEHVSTNILANRLKLLSSVGIIERTNPNAAARNNAYRLTDSGQELRPVLEALGRWSHSHLKTYHHDIVSLD